MKNISLPIEAIASMMAKKELKMQSAIYGANQNIYFLGDGINDALHLIVSDTGDYKAINNPLSDKETIQCGHLEEFLSKDIACNL